MVSSTSQITESFQASIAGKIPKELGLGRVYNERLIGYRREPKSILRVDKPTNPARARQLGYKAKKGFVVVRVKIRKGSGLHRRPYLGRRPKNMGVTKITRGKSIQSMAEMRASKKFTNCEVLNSYWVGEDGKYKFFEVILVDTAAPEIYNDPALKWVSLGVHSGRAERGLTSAGKKSRGLLHKGRGTEKIRPSLRAKNNQGK